MNEKTESYHQIRFFESSANEIPYSEVKLPIIKYDHNFKFPVTLSIHPTVDNGGMLTDIPCFDDLKPGVNFWRRTFKIQHQDNEQQTIICEYCELK
ncbi:MAG: hypothetical protein H0T84_08230 [Tatlockia sp.]|nr:hypothetical protein [Tatlockia sp.]